MWKEKVLLARDFILKNSKLVFPLIVIVVVAMTVTIALNAGSADEQLQGDESTTGAESTEQTMEPAETNVPLTVNEDSKVQTLMESYYNALADGDEETLRSICDEISDKDMLRYLETAKYTQAYPTLEIYTKPGPEEGSMIAYVYYKVLFDSYEEQYPGYQAHYICTNEQGELYLKRTENSEEVNQYIKAVTTQDDVVEFNNRINAEYNELMEQKPELLVYLKQLDSQVSTAVGEGLANLASGQDNNTQEGENAGESSEENQGDEGTETPAENATQYATATTTVNVRSSDSEQADKLGKVAGGTKVQVLEQRVNGWSKVLFENKEGYIKSEFLEMAAATETAEGAIAVGTVTATTNINVRASASETAEKVGTLVGGESAELIATENGWCKIKFNGQVAYVKADYVQ